jgi:hypothetical protein
MKEEESEARRGIFCRKNIFLFFRHFTVVDVFFLEKKRVEIFQNPSPHLSL